MITPGDIAGYTTAALDQLPTLFKEPDWQMIEYAAWLQAWPSTSCGHGGCAGQMVTPGLVIVAVVQPGEEAPEALVWSNGRLLHRRPYDGRVGYAISVQHVPGRGERWRLPS